MFPFTVTTAFFAFIAVWTVIASPLNHDQSNHAARDTNTSLSLPPHGQINCFHPSPRYVEPLVRDCAAALTVMKTDVPWYSEPQTFRIRPRAGEKPVPILFRDGTCEIYLNTTKPEESDTFSLEEVRYTVVDIMSDCLIKAKPGFAFGGVAGIGHNKGFHFKLLGVKRPGADGLHVGTGQTFSGKANGPAGDVSTNNTTTSPSVINGVLLDSLSSSASS